MDANADRGEWRLPSERRLSEEFGVGRRAVRAALATLASEERIWRHQGKGTFAGPKPAFSETLAASFAQKMGPLEVKEARLEIEPGLARLAAAKAPPEVVSRLDALRRQLALSSTPEQMERLDGAFHRQIAETAGNRLLLMTFDVIDRIRLTPSWRESRAQVRNAQSLRVTNEQHEAIVEAISRHDGRDAEFSMRRHLLTLHANLQESLFGRAADDPTPKRRRAGTKRSVSRAP
jgi:DNA-binding FadR family transcriptional regulator